MTTQPNFRMKLRLWQLFAVVIFVAVLVWLWPKVGIDVYRQPDRGSRIVIWWEGKRFVPYDTATEIRRKRGEELIRGLEDGTIAGQKTTYLEEVAE